MEGKNREEALSKRIIELYGRKNELLAKMLELTSGMGSLDVAEGPGEILALIEARQACMEKVDVLDREIAQLSGSLPECLAGAGEKIKEQRQSCLRLVTEIQELDRRQKAQLELQLTKFRELRDKLAVSRRTAGAYRKHTPLPRSVFIDKMK